MTTVETLLRQIIATPADDALRLAYADALDELPAVRVPCPSCKRPPDAVNHVTGHMFVGWGHGWHPCSRCDGSALVVSTAAADRAALIRYQIEFNAAAVTRDAETDDQWRRTCDEMKRFQAYHPYPEDVGDAPTFKVRPRDYGELEVEYKDRTGYNPIIRYARGFARYLAVPVAWFVAHADEWLWNPKSGNRCRSTAEPVTDVFVHGFPRVLWERGVARVEGRPYRDRLRGGDRSRSGIASRLLTGEFPHVDFHFWTVRAAD